MGTTLFQHSLKIIFGFIPGSNEVSSCRGSTIEQMQIDDDAYDIFLLGKYSFK